MFLLLVLGVLAAVSLLKVRFSSDLYGLLPADLPEVRGLQKLEAFFGRGSELVITVTGADTQEVEEAVSDLGGHLRGKVELVSLVVQERPMEDVLVNGGELFAWQWLNSDPESLRSLVNSVERRALPETIDRAFARMQDSFSEEDALLASYDPLRLIPEQARDQKMESFRSEDGKFAVLFVEGRGANFSDFREAAVWVDAIKEEVAEWSASQDGKVEVGFTGTPALMAEVGSAMQRDMIYTVVASLLLISLLFFLMHGEVRVLSWLVCSLLLIFVATMQLGSLILGELSVMTVGFAAVLLGLAVDYGVILYREGRKGVGSASQLRRRLGPSIWWAGGTTAFVFLSLNLGSFPGLGEMGLLVALGVLSGCAIMLFFFGRIVAIEDEVEVGKELARSPRGRRVAECLGAGIPLGGLLLICLFGLPDWQLNFHPFRLKESPAIASWQKYNAEMGRTSSVPLIVTAGSLQELRTRLADAEQRCEELVAEGTLERVTSFSVMMAHPENQIENRELLRRALSSSEEVLAALDRAGFSEQGMALTRAAYDSWAEYLGGVGELVPEPVSPWVRWIVGRVSSERAGEFAALVSVVPKEGVRDWIERLDEPHLAVASFSALGSALNQRVRADLRRVGWPMLGVIIVMLLLVFRCWRDVLLALHSLLTVAALLVMASHAGLLQWNSFNVFAILILLGTGLDYSIHMILALRREQGDCSKVWQGVGKGLLFCGASSVIGFGSLAFAAAHGLASLGVVCAVGMAVNTTVAVWLLPNWYLRLHNLRFPTSPS